MSETEAEGAVAGLAGEAGKLLVGALGEAAAFAAGVAIGPTLEPVVQAIKNESWQTYPDLPLDPATLAQGVAEGKLTEAAGAAEAKLSGLSQSAFDAFVTVLKQAPAVAAGLTLIRRGQLDPGSLALLLQRNGIESEFTTAYQAAGANKLQPWEEPLDPAVVANAIVRGVMAAPFDLPYSPPGAGGKVAAYPSSSLDAAGEASASGTSVDRLFVQTALAGRPIGPEEAAKASFRGIIEPTDYLRAIVEGDIRGEWAQALYDYSREILTAHDGAEAQLRGLTDADGRDAIAALHGMSSDDANTLYELMGRGLPVHQITTGLARGGTYEGGTSAIAEEYLDSMRRSSLRPEYFNLAYANRYTLPSYFVVRAILQAGGMTVEAATELFEQEGWPPDLASSAAQALAGSSTGSTSSHVKSAQTQAITKVRNAYVGGGVDETQAAAALDSLDVPAGDQATIIRYWQVIQQVEQGGGAATA